MCITVKISSSGHSTRAILSHPKAADPENVCLLPKKCITLSYLFVLQLHSSNHLSCDIFCY